MKVKLGEVVQISSTNMLAHPDRNWLLNLDMVEQQTGNIIEYKYVAISELGGSIISFDTDIVLYSKLRPNLNKVVVPQITGYATSEMLPLKPNEKYLTREYLAAFLRSDSFVTWAVSKTAGAKMPRLGTKELLGKEIYLPSLENQRNIVAVLDKVSDLIAMRKKQLQKLDDLVKSRFLEMFGDTANNPMNWPTMTFRQASIRLNDGPFGSNLKSEHYTQSGVRVIRLGNIGVGRFIDDDQSYISIDHYETIKKYTCKAGDIVIGTLGDPNLRACIIPNEIDIAINKADCVHYVPKTDILDNYFVCQYINCPETLLLASGMIHGQTRARVSSGQIAEMPIFIPPLELQRQFAAFVGQTDKSKSTIQQSLDKLELLKKALMQKYFG